MGPALSSGLLCMKRLGVLLLPPGWDASPSQGYPQHICWYLFVHLGSVVRRLISANTRLNFNLDFFIPLFKCLFGIVYRVLFRASNDHILDKKNSTEFSFKAIRSEIRFHTNPGLS